MNKGEQKHRRSISLLTGRQRSIFILELKRLQYISYLGRDPIGLNEVDVIYDCLVCSVKVEKGKLLRHFAHDLTHFEIGLQILRLMVADGELERINVAGEILA